MPSKYPKTWDKEVYIEALSIITKHRQSFKSNAEAELAKILGGSDMVAAIDKDKAPPCDDVKCDKCWLEPWCVHKNDLEIHKIINALTDKKGEESEDWNMEQLDKAMKDII